MEAHNNENSAGAQAGEECKGLEATVGHLNEQQHANAAW